MEHHAWLLGCICTRFRHLLLLLQEHPVLGAETHVVAAVGIPRWGAGSADLC